MGSAEGPCWWFPEVLLGLDQVELKEEKPQLK